MKEEKQGVQVHVIGKHSTVDSPPQRGLQTGSRCSQFTGTATGMQRPYFGC